MKGRMKRATGGVNQAAQDAGKKNLRYTYQSNVQDEAEERKRGGKVGMKAKGDKAKANMGRMPRKSGGKVLGGTEWAAAQGKGKAAPGRTTDGSLT